jgi:hypothetical protein
MSDPQRGKRLVEDRFNLYNPTLSVMTHREALKDRIAAPYQGHVLSYRVKHLLLQEARFVGAGDAVIALDPNAISRVSIVYT